MLTLAAILYLAVVVTEAMETKMEATETETETTETHVTEVTKVHLSYLQRAI